MDGAAAHDPTDPQSTTLPTVKESISEAHPQLWTEQDPDRELEKLWAPALTAAELRVPKGLSKLEDTVSAMCAAGGAQANAKTHDPVVSDGPMYVGTGGFKELDRCEYVITDLLESSYITTAVLRRSGCHPECGHRSDRRAEADRMSGVLKKLQKHLRLYTCLLYTSPSPRD